MMEPSIMASWHRRVVNTFHLLSICLFFVSGRGASCGCSGHHLSGGFGGLHLVGHRGGSTSSLPKDRKDWLCQTPEILGGNWWKSKQPPLIGFFWCKFCAHHLILAPLLGIPVLQMLFPILPALLCPSQSVWESRVAWLCLLFCGHIAKMELGQMTWVCYTSFLLLLWRLLSSRRPWIGKAQCKSPSSYPAILYGTEDFLGEDKSMVLIFAGVCCT